MPWKEEAGIVKRVMQRTVGLDRSIDEVLDFVGVAHIRLYKESFALLSPDHLHCLFSSRIDVANNNLRAVSRKQQ